MRILFVSAEYPPAVGGVGAYTEALARALAALGAEVAILTSAPAPHRPLLAQEGASPLEQGDGGAPIEVLRRVGRWGPSSWAEGEEIARTWGADWLHVQYQTAAFAMNPAINFAPARWSRALPQARVAWTYHDLLPPYLFPKAGAWLRDWVTLRPAHSASLTIVTNEGDRQRLEHLALRAEQIPIGSNIPLVTLTEAERAAARLRYELDPTARVIGFFGFLNRSKGAPTLLRTLRRLLDGEGGSEGGNQAGRDVKLLLIGEGLGASDPSNRATQAEVHALVAELGLTEHVVSTGALSDQLVAEALNAVDLLLLPFEDGASLRRGTLMAGLLNGCAIVTTPPQAPLPELTFGRDLLAAPPGDDAAFARQAARLLADPALAESVRAAARTASARFGWRSIALRHMALYNAPPSQPA